MIYHVYSLLDTDMNAFGIPQYDIKDIPQTLEGVRRAIIKKQFDPHAQKLYYLGTFDDNSGEIVPEFKEIANCELLVRKEKADE